METELQTLKDASFLAGQNENLCAIWDSTDQALAKMAHLNEVWCRSRTGWSLANITATAQGPDNWKRMRQVSAEIESRRAAMIEAKWELLRLQLEIDDAKAKHEHTHGDIERRRLVLEIGEKEDRIEGILRKLKGAMRDVLDLDAIYNSLSKEIGDVNEANVEAAEHRAHLTRAITQSIRSVRIMNAIDAGNQEYLEQCGVNPSTTLNEIRKYLDTEMASGRVDVGQLNEFIKQYTDHLLSVIQASPVIENA